ncbi:zinc finger protein AEBP2-like isoform X1 [Carassius carassius]|uniref:zinc finger protein AEBP2-like isoform X1 n=1 Tax=Carassius carassius TaxID=217509 RepID=UPI0028694E40|nr:zinc finger protein AEBP2-like isoform X1 [Carassius carassius]
MAAMNSDGSEQESSSPSEQNRDGSESGLRAADPEPAVKMDAAETDEKLNGRESTEQKTEEAMRGDTANDEDGETEAETEKEPQKSPGGADGTTERMKGEQREEESASPPAEKNSGNGGGLKRRASLEIMSSSSEGEPLSRMDSEDSISSTLMDMESIASSGRSTPAMMNGHGGVSSSSTKGSSYPCCWDQCHMLFNSSPDLAEHIRGVHVDGQRGGVFVCHWKGCKVYNTPSTSQSWLQRHMLSHSGDKPFKCVVGGCNATFASQGGLARHVPTHFSSQNSSKLSSQAKVKEESPSKAGINKRRKLKYKRRRSLRKRQCNFSPSLILRSKLPLDNSFCFFPPARPHDFFDAQTMDAIRHRAICLNLATHIESQGKGHSVVFHSTVIAKRKEDSGKVKVLLHWTPEDILPDAWVSESDRPQLKTKVVHLSQLPQDTAVLLDPNIYRMFF